MNKYVGSNALLYTTNKLKTLIEGKVSKETGKGLSTNDLTDELKAKILAAGDSSFSGNYEDLTNKPDLTVLAKTADVTTAITTATKDLASTAAMNTAITSATAGLASSDDMTTAINNAVNGLASEEFVTNKLTAVYSYKGSVANKAALPTADQKVGDTYNLEDTGMNTAWNGTDWDDLGPIIDLTGYVKETDLVEVTNAEIDSMFTE